MAILSTSPVYQCVRFGATFLTLLLVFPSSIVWAHGSNGTAFYKSGLLSNEQAVKAEKLTLSLGDLIIGYKAAGASENKAIEERLIGLAQERRALLNEIIAKDPAQALRLALPSHLQKDVPPGVQTLLEKKAEMEGELEVLHEDNDDPSQSRYLYFLVTPQGERVALHFIRNPPKRFSGERVRAEGVSFVNSDSQETRENDVAMVVEDGNTSVVTLELNDSGSSTTTSTGTSMIVVPNTFGAQKVAVLLVNFSDKPNDRPFTTSQAREFVFGPVSNFYRENSYGQAWLTGDVFGWYTMSITTSNCSSIASYADAAATAAGVNLANYSRIVYFIAPSKCGGNSGTVGGTPSRAYIRSGLDLRVVTHEMGHNFGLYHSQGLNCSGGVLASNCVQDEYGDMLDVMGYSNGGAAHFNVFQKEWLGWLNYNQSPPIIEATANGNYVLSPVETNGAGPKGLRILRSMDPQSGKKNWYFLEYRQPIGFDQFLFNSADAFKYPDNLSNGVVIHSGSEADRNSSVLLDMTPDSFTTTVYSDMRDPALELGSSYTDDAAGLTITPLWTSASGAEVNINFGNETCVRANPVLGLSPAESQWVEPGTPVNYTVTVTNKDNSACGVSRFGLQTAFPVGWTAALSSLSLSVAPGASASATFTVTSPVLASDGFYPLTVTASQHADAGYLASGSVTYVVMNTVLSNQAPTAVNDSAVTTEGTAVTIPVLMNDWDPDGDLLTTTSVTQATNGKVSLKADGKVVYTPNARFKGTDNFSYQITDGVNSATAAVSVAVRKGTAGGGKGKP
jgi:hypothetical protein